MTFPFFDQSGYRQGERRYTRDEARRVVDRSTEEALSPDADDDAQPQPSPRVLVRVTGIEDPKARLGVYSWEYAVALDEGAWARAVVRFAGTFERITPGDDTTPRQLPLWEINNNPRVPIDGSAIVEAVQSSGGNYLSFSWPSTELMPARITAMVRFGDRWAYNWREQGPAIHGAWSDMTNGRVGISECLAYEDGNSGSVPIGSLVWLRRGYGASPDVVTTVAGDGHSFQIFLVNATGGSWTLTLADPDGNVSTVGPFTLATTTAALQTAIRTATGFSAATVTGSGTQASPWVVTADTLSAVGDPFQLAGVQEWAFRHGESDCGVDFWYPCNESTGYAEEWVSHDCGKTYTFNRNTCMPCPCGSGVACPCCTDDYCLKIYDAAGDPIPGMPVLLSSTFIPLGPLTPILGGYPCYWTSDDTVSIPFLYPNPLTPYLGAGCVRTDGLMRGATLYLVDPTGGFGGGPVVVFSYLQSGLDPAGGDPCAATIDLYGGAWTATAVPVSDPGDCIIASGPGSVASGSGCADVLVLGTASSAGASVASLTKSGVAVDAGNVLIVSVVVVGATPDSVKYGAALMTNRGSATIPGSPAAQVSVWALIAAVDSVEDVKVTPTASAPVMFSIREQEPSTSYDATATATGGATLPTVTVGPVGPNACEFFFAAFGLRNPAPAGSFASPFTSDGLALAMTVSGTTYELVTGYASQPIGSGISEVATLNGASVADWAGVLTTLKE